MQSKKKYLAIGGIICLLFILFLVFVEPRIRMIPDPIPYTILSNNIQLRQEVQEAILKWENENPNLQFQEVNNTLSLTFMFTKEPISLPRLHNDLVSGFTLCAVHIPWCTVTLYAPNDTTFPDTVAHEIGHVLGLCHIQNSQHLMHGTEVCILPNYDRFNIPNKTDTP